MGGSPSPRSGTPSKKKQAAALEDPIFSDSEVASHLLAGVGNGLEADIPSAQPDPKLPLGFEAMNHAAAIHTVGGEAELEHHLSTNRILRGNDGMYYFSKAHVEEQNEQRQPGSTATTVPVNDEDGGDENRGGKETGEAKLGAAAKKAAAKGGAKATKAAGKAAAAKKTEGKGSAKVKAGDKGKRKAAAAGEDAAGGPVLKMLKKPAAAKANVLRKPAAASDNKAAASDNKTPEKPSTQLVAIKLEKQQNPHKDQ